MRRTAAAETGILLPPTTQTHPAHALPSLPCVGPHQRWIGIIARHMHVTLAARLPQRADAAVHLPTVTTPLTQHHPATSGSPMTGDLQLHIPLAAVHNTGTRTHIATHTHNGRTHAHNTGKHQLQTGDRTTPSTTITRTPSTTITSLTHPRHNTTTNIGHKATDRIMILYNKRQPRSGTGHPLLG